MADLTFPMYSIAPSDLGAHEAFEIGAMQESETNKYFGLLFTSEDRAKKYMYILNLKERVYSIPDVEALAKLSRRMLHNNTPIESYLIDLDPKSVNPCKELLVWDAAKLDR